ncbi:uncharacterized protein LOC144502550 [Mustelus asterias]
MEMALQYFRTTLSALRSSSLNKILSEGQLHWEGIKVLTQKCGILSPSKAMDDGIVGDFKPEVNGFLFDASCRVDDREIYDDALVKVKQQKAPFLRYEAEHKDPWT